MDSSVDIYLLVEATAYELGMPAPITVSESLLVRDGCFIGHKFRFDGGYAIWGEGWNSVEFYDDAGKLLKMVAVERAASSSPHYNRAG